MLENDRTLPPLIAESAPIGASDLVAAIWFLINIRADVCSLLAGAGDINIINLLSVPPPLC